MFKVASVVRAKNHTISCHMRVGIRAFYNRDRSQMPLWNIDIYCLLLRDKRATPPNTFIHYLLKTKHKSNEAVDLNQCGKNIRSALGVDRTPHPV